MAVLASLYLIDILTTFQKPASRWLFCFPPRPQCWRGFESPFGMELLATVDWLIAKENIAPTVSAVREGLRTWSGGPGAAERKDQLFDDRALGIALERLTQSAPAQVMA